MIWCAVWLICITESPLEDKHITKQELKYIIDSIGPTDDSKSKIYVISISSNNMIICVHEQLPRISIYVSIFDFFFLVVSLLDYPWKDILTSMPVWAITCAHFCENWGFYTLLTQLPSYMNGNHLYNIIFLLKKISLYLTILVHTTDVLKFNIGKGSLLSALPYLVMSIILQFSGFFVDWLRKNEILTTTQVPSYLYNIIFYALSKYTFIIIFQNYSRR